MSDFWDLEDFDFKSGGFDSNAPMAPIPEGTCHPALIEAVAIEEYKGETFIKATWQIVDGEYKNRKVFHKIRVFDEDKAKATKARKMLAVIDFNAKAGIMESGKKPDHAILQGLCFKPMAITVAVWDMDGNTGNWVRAVSAEVPQEQKADDVW